MKFTAFKCLITGEALWPPKTRIKNWNSWIYDGLQWAGHMVRVRETKDTYRILVGKPLEKCPLKRQQVNAAPQAWYGLVLMGMNLWILLSHCYSKARLRN